MDLMDFQAMIDRIKHCALRVSLYDEGEPLMHKDIYRMIAYASGLNISTLVCTNLTLFREKDLESLFQSKLSVLEPCLDGFSQEVYARYRKGGKVHDVKSSIQMITAFKRTYRMRWPHIDAQIILFEHVMKEIPQIVQFLRGCKVDRITFRNEILGYSASDDSVLPSRMPEIPRANRCFWLYLGMMIRPDGNVYPCCGRGFNRFPYGNLLIQDLSQIWNNRYYQFSRALFSNGPPLRLAEDFKQIPCLTCDCFNKSRKLIEG